MNAATFTDHDFDVLVALLLPFDEMRPDLSPHFDRLCWHLSARLEGEYIMSFGDFRSRAKEARASRTVTSGARSAFQMGLIALVLSETIKRIATQFPDIDRHCDRVMYEIIRVIEEMEGKAKFDCFRHSARNFDEFHLDHRMRRRVFNSQIKGVG